MNSPFLFDYGTMEYFINILCQKLSGTEAVYSTAILREICGRFHRDLPRMKEHGADKYKHSALITFWIKKLHPIYIQPGQPHLLNEIFAYYFGVCVILHKDKDKLSYPIQSGYKNILNEFIYALRYRNMTPQNIDIIYKAMYPRIIQTSKH